EGKIVLAASCDNGELVTRIRDNGIGIPPKMLASIFEMFEQVQDRSEYPQAGLGIGLSVVKELVEMHEGHVVAHSEGVNKGSEFIVKLPVLHNQEAAADQKSDGPPQRNPVDDETTSSKKKILLVDDNTDAADMMELLLKKKGYEIRKAYNGETAIVSAMEFNPEIVLLDLGLPDISGYDVLRTLQEKPGKRAYIALSGWGQEEDLSRSKQAGFDHHLVKPIDIHSLTEILASVR
ncbi:MAG TPA: response regulator, partial [Chitinophagaceae bacterium]|nr:response regulator [Chitinophagaceae bacterium]